MLVRRGSVCDASTGCCSAAPASSPFSPRPVTSATLLSAIGAPLWTSGTISKAHGANGLQPAIAPLVATTKAETGETRTPSTNSLHPDLAYLGAVGQQVENHETWTPDANSLHPDIAHLL